MTPFEEEQVLESMIILHDTREQNTDRSRRRYASFGIAHDTAVLDYGDYTYNATLPDGSQLLDCSTERIFPMCVIERKMNLDELAQCFTQERKRFKAEMERVREHGAKMWLLVEDATWENLLNGKYRSKMNPSAFVASLVAWSVRYNLTPIFCKEESSGRLIKEILFRDLKERLQSNEYG